MLGVCFKKCKANWVQKGRINLL